ncbi:hypothetical protein ACOI1H_14575 [Loktanella sp. DJP18]|uniref:hypothetical protein n=1 Tax=Loktanella sp. DJP18 TaxID=3409788 RepID=UPI003BB68902
MRWLPITAVISGVLATIGGAGFLYVKDFKVQSIEVWRIAFNFLLDDPARYVSQVIVGDQGQLLGGILVSFIGVSVLTGTLIVSCLTIISSFVIRLLRRIRFSVKGAKSNSPRASNSLSSSDAKNDKLKRFKLPSLSLPKIGKTAFEDGSANLEGRGGSEVLTKVRVIYQGWMKRRVNTGATQVIVSFGGASKVIAEVSHDVTFYEDVKAWHARVKKSSGTDLSLVEEARMLRKSMTNAVAEMVLEEDPMNGHFLMRMLTAWADKTHDTGVTQKVVVKPAVSGETTLIQTAINDVMMNGISTENDGEDRVDLDDNGAGFLPDELFDIIRQDELLDAAGNAENLPKVDPSADRDIALEDDEGETPFLDPGDFVGASDDVNDGDVDVGEAPSQISASDAEHAQDNKLLEGHLKIVFELSILSSEVAEGVIEWPEYYQETRQRVKALEDAMIAIIETINTTDDSVIESWLEEYTGASEWDWFGENWQNIERVRSDLLEAVVAGDNEDDSGDAEGGGMGEVDDFSVTTKAFGGGAKPKVGQKFPPAVETPDVVAGDRESNAVVVDDAEQEAFTDVSPEGQNLSLDQLEEVEMCDELLTKWGYAAKAAGASEAKIVSTVVSKIGLKRKVEGVLHMTATWKDSSKAEVRRINIIFRYVPEGSWTLNVGEDVRLVDGRGNYVMVRGTLLNHPELKDQTTVIHFYGEGVSSPIEIEPVNGVHVVSKVLSPDEVKKIVFV